MALQKKNVRSILIIDDDPDDYELVSEAIQEINPSIGVTYVNSCEQLLQHRHQTFDLILLDINMPYHDGFFLLKSIREHGYRDLPIIMYTNSLSPAHITKAYKEGANLFFSKPESFSALLNGLRKLVDLDWASPFSVTQQYCKNGHYKAFQAD
ncbi:response regulator [Flavisolibacter nicotianae]|uniref:response regulator n=1 Tax=Flavisolibacter nicotianae TaxID=2364882 RepID=UPI000EAB7D08|nr:response regulator [Flavisolibacter nicotianae]